MQLIDTHTHIYCEEFDDDREAVVARAVEAGVIKMLLPAIDSNTTQRQSDLEQGHPTLFRQMMGLHPTSVNANFEQELAWVERHLNDPSQHYVAIGEIGLDLYWDTTYKEQQIEVLKRQMRWAQEKKLPVALHIRNAYEEVFDVLSDLNYSTFQGVFHCYSGTLEQAYRVVEMGFHLGIGGVLTYKKSTLPEIVQAIALDKILLETDSPYLAPTPKRGQRNESSFLLYVAQTLANIKNCPLDTVAERTTYNAKRLFNLD